MSTAVITKTYWFKWFEENSKNGTPPDPKKLIEHYTKNKLTPPSSEEMDRIYSRLYGFKSPTQIAIEEAQRKEHAELVKEAKEVKQLKKVEKEKAEAEARANMPVTVTIEGVEVSNDEPDQPPATTAASAATEAAPKAPHEQASADLLAEVDAVYQSRRRSCTVFKKD